MAHVTSVVIIGGGPGGYEAALVAAQLGASVTIVDRDGIGGSAVLTDCVPSKTLIATAGVVTQGRGVDELGVDLGGINVDFKRVNERVLALAKAQSDDIVARLEREGIRIINGTGKLDGPHTVVTSTGETLDADAVLIATGTRPRVLEDALPDGERILTWEQLYDLPELPSKLIVVGSGVTGAEFASAYYALGSEVVLISSRDRVLPGEDPDAAKVLEDVFVERGVTVMANSRAVAARREGDKVIVTLKDGQEIEGSHVLMAVGSQPNVEDLNLESAGVELDDRGFIKVDRVSRTTARGVYAAGDCTGVLMLASVAAMQGRIAMWHALGDAVQPIDLTTVCSAIFTDPEIATVGYTQRDLDEGNIRGEVVILPLATNARAKMDGVKHGFVKLICRRGSRIVAGGVIVGPRASELIFPLTVAVEQRLTVDQLASTFTVYPSLSGSIAEAARRLRATE